MPAKQEGTKKRLLFVCIENSSRSVMAEGFAKEFGFDASSAGTIPSTHVNSLVVQAMKEVGVDVSGSKPRALSAQMVDHADLVVLTDVSLEKAMPGDIRKKMRKKAVEWNLADPQGMSIEEIRLVRDEIEEVVRALAKGSSGAVS